MQIEINSERLAEVQARSLQFGDHSPEDGGMCVSRRAPAAQRLAAKLQGAGECLVWTGHRTDQGYGRIGVNGRQVGAHRLAWELVHGPVPEGLCVLHRCDNPPCCHVDHLFLGTVAVNNADRAAKGRSKGVFPAGDAHPAARRRGEKHWQSRLSDSDVACIRESRAVGVPVKSLSARFGVHHATISRIANGVWRKEVSL